MKEYYFKAQNREGRIESDAERDGEIAHIFRHVERVECLGPRTKNVS